MNRRSLAVFKILNGPLSIFFPRRKKESLLLFTARLLSLPRARVETNLSLSPGSRARSSFASPSKRVCVRGVLSTRTGREIRFFFEKLFPLLFFFSSSFHLGFFNFFLPPHNFFFSPRANRTLRSLLARARLCELERDDARDVKRRRRTRRKEEERADGLG